MTQINPPYDSSAPCPGCQIEVRSLSASIHNFLTRCDVRLGRVREGKAMLRLNDLRRFTSFPIPVTIPHPAVTEIVAVGLALVEAVEGMTDDGGMIRWTPEITAKVEALIPRAAAASDAYDVVSEAHFRDSRHSQGEPNLLRESRGSRWAGFVNPDYAGSSYDYTVEIVPEGGDLVHEPCGTHLKLHEHFKERLRGDPTFYGKVWCKTCGVNAAWPQFTAHLD